MGAELLESYYQPGMPYLMEGQVLHGAVVLCDEGLAEIIRQVTNGKSITNYYAYVLYSTL